MIKMLRIDERLIHGQVAIAWSKVLSVSAIVVANDIAAEDEMLKMTLKMAAPQGVKVAIRSVKGAIELLNDSRCEKMSILIVVNNPKDALDIVKEVNNIPLINLGNFGKIDNKIGGRKKLSEGIYVSDEESKVLENLIETGVEVEVRMVPERPKVYLKDIMNK